MTWLGDHWLDILGWGGSALLVYSLLQSSLLRLRALNAVACMVLIVFNGLLEVWPMVGMNVVLVGINLWFIAAMLRTRHDDSAYEVLAVGSQDAYLLHLLRVHDADIRRFNPGLPSVPGSDLDAFLVQRGDETVGMVLLREEQQTARIVLDYVTPRYRDFSPGEFVWRRSGLLVERGIRRVVTPPDMVGAYYDRLGFRREGGSWVLEVPQ